MSDEDRHASRSAVVCGIDHSPHARAAARVAAALADRLGLRLIIVHVLPTEPVPSLTTAPPDAVFDRGAVRREAAEKAAGLLADAVAEAGHGTATSRIEDGSASERLAAVAEEQHAELVVVGTRGEGPAQAALLGSVSTETVQRAPCAVVVVPPAAAHKQREPLADGAMVCGVKGPDDRRVVHGAARLAASLAMRLKVAHVGDPQDGDVPGGSVHSVPLASAAAPTGRPLEHARALLGPMVIAARKIAPQVDDPALLAGDPAERLAAFADELPASLLVVGTRGRGPIRAGLLGSVSRSLASSAAVPVVVDPLRSARCEHPQRANPSRR